MHDGNFERMQREYFAAADQAKFAWQTRNSFFASTERRLLAGMNLSGVKRFLEVGCGEGGNLFFLRESPARKHGVDFSQPKLEFARRNFPEMRFIRADALSLPFKDGSFDFILARDVLHHLPDQPAALREMRRVLQNGKTLMLVEGTARNPLMALFALLRESERGMFAISPRRVQRWLESGGGFQDINVITRQPLPLYRALLHYQYGLPGLGDAPFFRACMEACERLAARIIPRRHWGYVVATAAKV